ncbi:MAG: hypothetical protein LBC44_00485 [Mycoplasmataceae bacterium]|nr:hypothetical protein [Mycoplasmataceae bacterium]
MKNQLTVEIVEKWTDTEFQKYRLFLYNNSHQLKTNSVPEWYIPTKNALLKFIKNV